MLERCGADLRARYVNFFIADDYPSSIDMATALHPQTLLATGYAGADLLMDIQNSPIAMAVAKVATERHRIVIATGAAVPALTRGAYSKYVYHYSFDSVAIESATANYLAALPDGKLWVVIAADAGFDRGALATVTPIVASYGGQIAKTFIVPPARPTCRPSWPRSGASTLT